MAKKSAPPPEPSNDDGVDMGRIEAMMGPTPDKAGRESSAGAAGPDAARSDDKGVGAAVREFNEALKAKMPGLGGASIKKVTDQDEAKLPKLTGAEATAEPIADSADETPTAPEVDGAPVPKEPSATPKTKHPVDPAPAETSTGAADQEATEETPAEDDLAAAKKALDPESKKAKETVAEEDVDDPGLSKAVDDIVASETDELLAMEDEKKAEVSTRKPRKSTDGPGWRDHLSEFIHRPAFKWYALAVVAVVLLVAALLPWSRYFVLNTAGVRVSSNVEVIDQATLQPLKNVTVSFGAQSAVTDANGKASVTGVKQGPNTLVVKKSAYAVVTKHVTLGWGSNPLGRFQLTPTGNQYTFMVTDFLSGKPVETAAATSGDGDAEADKNGKIVLTLATKDDASNLTVKISADGFRDEAINLTANNKAVQNIKMVPARKDVFVSKRSGKYDVYTVDVDGKNPQRIVAGTGLERDDIALVNHPTDAVSALADTRENTRNSDGYLLTTLYTIDQKSGELTKVDQSERIQIIGWTADDHLVYVKIVAGASANNPQRQRLISYNTKKSSDTKELAASNSFNDILMINDKVYYASSAAFQPAANIGLFRVNGDGTSKVNIFNQEVYNIFRTDYDTLYLSVGTDWYTHKLSGDSASKANGAPATQVSHLYVDSADNAHSLWVDQRDGQGVLLNHDVKANTDKALVTKAGVKNPVEWLNDHYIVYRLSDGHETADYVLNTQGGTPQKITDVTDAASVSSWYYY